MVVGPGFCGGPGLFEQSVLPTLLMSDDDRYRRGDHAGINPSEILVELVTTLWPAKVPDSRETAPKRALDIAGGAGRNAIWLAKNGWQTTIVDISAVGLEIAQQRSRQFGCSLSTLCADMERDGIPTGPWDLIICMHYLGRKVYATIADALSADGRAIIIQPTMRNLERHARPPAEFLLQEGELPGLLTGLALLEYREGWSVEGRHDAVAVASARRTPSEPSHRK